MSTNDEFERISSAWLADGPTELADRVLDAALHEVHLTNQRRRLALWRTTHMSFLSSNMARLAAVVVVAIVALGGAFYLLGPNRGGVGGPVSTPTPTIPLPTPSPSAAPTPTATPPSTVGWHPFSSSHYRYRIAYPPTWAATQATRDWAFAKDRLALEATAPGGAVDVFVGGPTGNETAVFGFAADVPAGTSEDAWLASYYAGGNFCPTIPTFVPITVDGHPGRLDPCYDAQAFVFVGNRVYVFVIFRTGQQPLFRGFLSTVKFPASPPSGSPAPSVSPS